MGYSLTVAGYDLSDYLVSRPVVKVALSSMSGGFYVPEMQVNLRWVRGLWTGDGAAFPEPSGLAAVIAYNGVTLFDGQVSSVVDRPAGVVLTLRAALGAKLGQVVSWESTLTTPAAAAKGILESVGLTCDGSFLAAHAIDALAGGLVNCYAALADNATVAQIVAELADIATADVYVDKGVVYWSTRGADSCGYTVSRADNIPSVSNDGSGAQQTAYSIRYLFDGQVPMAGGDGDKVWKVDAGNTARVQIYGSASALYYGARRIAARATQRPVHKFRLRPGDVPLFPGSLYPCTLEPLSGIYRLVGYATDGKTYDVEVA
jgi:hypothetical protein